MCSFQFSRRMPGNTVNQQKAGINVGFLFLSIIALLLMIFAPNLWKYLPFLLPFVAIYFVWVIYKAIYFNSSKFREIKDRIKTHVDDCNNLNRHIDQLKNYAIIVDRTDYGNANYSDKSNWNFKRPKLDNSAYSPNVYNCSRSVCDGARQKPFTYVCKYFGISATEENLSKFEEMLNNFEAASEGQKSLLAERSEIIKQIESDVPNIIKKHAMQDLEDHLGFERVDFSGISYPHYTFKYVSPGGNASTECDVVMDIENLNEFIHFLSEKIKFNKSAAGQRALMTSRLRQEIKARDNYTCKMCGASTYNEPNLLLEIDHIIPVAKGGLTNRKNLQTLCWRCNRTKGAKITVAQ